MNDIEKKIYIDKDETESSRPSGLQQRRLDGRRYWTGDVVQTGDVDWPSEGGVG